MGLQHLIKSLNKKHKCFEYEAPNRLKCVLCGTSQECDSAHVSCKATRHVVTQKHLKNSEKSNVRHEYINTSLFKDTQWEDKQKYFNQRLTKTLKQLNIPFNILEKKPFREFLCEFTKMQVPSESTLRKSCMLEMYKEMESKIIDEFRDAKIFIIADEATVRERKVLNIQFGKLTEGEAVIRLFEVKEMTECDAGAISQAITNAVSKIFENNVDRNCVLGFISDQAPTMVKAGKLLKKFYPKMKHVSCLIHALHRVATKLIDFNNVVNRFVACFQTLFERKSSKMALYKEVTKLPFPPSVCLTRWGTWIKAVSFIVNNFEVIKNFIKRLDNNDRKSTDELKELIKDPLLEKQLYCVYQVRKLPEIMMHLEGSNLELAEQIKLFEEAEALIAPFSELKEKLEESLSKNPDIKYFREEISLQDRIILKYMPLVSVEVERTFSALKLILTDRKDNLTPEHLKQYLMFYVNQF